MPNPMMTREPENWNLLAALSLSESDQWFYLPLEETHNLFGQALLNRYDAFSCHDPENWRAIIKENPGLWQERCRCGRHFPTREALQGHMGGLSRGQSWTAVRQRHGVVDRGVTG